MREDGGWRVAYSRSRLVPEYPSDALAGAAATRVGDGPPGVPHRRRVVRRVGRTRRRSPRRLCRPEWSGRGRLRRLPVPDDTSASSLAAAFGPDVYAWARLVPVTEPARLDLIVAPVGERWLVIGVREASASVP